MVSADQVPFSDLPADATNISYYLPGMFGTSIYLEFDTSEGSFTEWAQRQSTPALEPLEGNTPRSVTRYDHDTGEPVAFEIRDGIFYEVVDEKKHLRLAYDRKAGRAYFDLQPPE